MAQLPLVAVQAEQMAMPQQKQPFVWGQGGKRMTPEEIAIMRELAGEQMAEGMDYSPVGHWTQGLARVGQGIVGGLKARQADKATEANKAETDAVMQALMQPDVGGDVAAAAMGNAYISPQAQKLAGMIYKKGDVSPVIQRANNGDILGLNPQTGEVMFKNVDPNPKPVLDWITARNPDGTQTLIPMGVDGPVNQSGYGAPTAPVGKLTPIEPTTDNTLAPQLGDNGLPARLNREQYMATVNAMGKEATDAWIARNNVKVQQ